MNTLTLGMFFIFLSPLSSSSASCRDECSLPAPTDFTFPPRNPQANGTCDAAEHCSQLPCRSIGRELEEGCYLRYYFIPSCLEGFDDLVPNNNLRDNTP
jgi:hypothetical protein